MTATPNEPDLEAIAKRCEAASPGPWEGDADITCHSGVAAVRERGVFDWICSMQISNCPNWKADLAFIAHARQDIPLLLAALTAERQRREEAEQECEEQSRLNGMGAEREVRLLARIDRLTEGLRRCVEDMWLAHKYVDSDKAQSYAACRVLEDAIEKARALVDGGGV